MEILVKAGQFLLAISILVVLHEFGHFIFAKIFKTRVEKFYLFFNPWFSIFKKKFGETEYGIGWLPLGGYVKISGMIDESMDKEQMKLPAQPYEFRSKPSWQRLVNNVGRCIGEFCSCIIYLFSSFIYLGRAVFANQKC
ncbi:MAG: site-2 protease family protein [Marinilabiliales bacterium]|nr:site-2 protease family protein [Marinilabiliales bacterium]